jgi:hypothetical protein
VLRTRLDTTASGTDESSFRGQRRALSAPFSTPVDRSEAALSRRIEELDAVPLLGSDWPRDVKSKERYLAARLGHFISVMRRWTDTYVEVEVGPRATIAPGAADALASRSRLLAEIERSDSSLIAGPLDKTVQHWTPTGRSAWNGEPPSEERFIAPQVDQPAAVKPFGFGLYTSTASAAGVSMWRAFLGPGGSRAYPLPRYTWELDIDKDAAVAEIGSATAWAELVCAHPRISNDLVSPDWLGVAQKFDAVHVTLPAIAAGQGFYFDTSQGVVPRAFWDVETTFWLRWCFSGMRLVESINATDHGRR